MRILGLSILLALFACDAPDARLKAEGNLHFQQGAYEKARGAYESAVRSNPKDPGARILLGNAWFELHDNQAARREYEEALRLDPKAPEAHRALAIVIARDSKSGDRAAFADFLAHIEAVIAANPRDRNAILSAAQVLSEYANPADHDAYAKAQNRAEELLRGLLPGDDRDPKTLFQLALVYARKGDAATAMNVANRLVAVGTDKGHGDYARAVVYALLGQADEALNALDVLLKHDYLDPETLRTDTLLESIAQTPRFSEILERAATRRKGEK